VELWVREFLTGSLVPTPPIGKKYLSFLSVGLAVSSGGPSLCNERSQKPVHRNLHVFGAVTMIGLALTGTLQMRVAHSLVVAAVAARRRGISRVWLPG
jgi:hypothetical protein